MQQEALAGASYIVSLFSDLQNLNSAFASYNSFHLFLKSKHGGEEPIAKAVIDEEEDILGEDEKQNFLRLVNNLSYYVEVVHIKMNALKDAAEFKIDALNAKHNEITGYVKDLEIGKIKEFVIEANKVFVDSVIQDFLLRAHDLISRFGKYEQQ